MSKIEYFDKDASIRVEYKREYNTQNGPTTVVETPTGRVRIFARNDGIITLPEEVIAQIVKFLEIQQSVVG